MPLALSVLKSRRNNYSTTSPRRNLYFPPGGHAYDRHSIPTDQLCISFSDPVLVAAEQELRELSLSKLQTRGMDSTHALRHVSRTRSMNKTSTPERSPMLRLPVGYGFVSRGSTNLPISEPWSRLSPTTISPDMTPRGIRKGIRSTATISKSGLSDSSEISESSPMYETMTPDRSANSTSVNGHPGPNLAPLASEAFKEELYIRGYLKRPTIRTSNVTSHKPRINLVFTNRGVIPQALGRRQGQRLAVQLRTSKDASTGPDGVNTSLAGKQPPSSSTYFSCVSPPTPASTRNDSPETNSTASEPFDLHEFSYITAFTTPPSSPSVALDAEIIKKGA